MISDPLMPIAAFSRRWTVRRACIPFLVFSLVLFLALSLSPTPARGDINGHLEVVEGKYVLTVWGTHAERGYAAGRLLGHQGKAVFDDYFVGYFCGGSAYVYNLCRTTFVNNFAVDPEYASEAGNMLLGMIDAGVDLYNATLGRDLDATDLLTANAIVDLSQLTALGSFGCSSLSSWGAGTAADPELAGHLVITRHLDWSRHPTLRENAAVVVHLPAEPDERAWISLTYAGLFGALSGVSESGLAAFLNMGNYVSGSAGRPYHPILLTLRSGLESADYDGDGQHAAGDIVAAISDRARCAAVIIHTVLDAGADSEPIVVECNNSAGVAVRVPADDPAIPAGHLVATNHFRVLYPPVYCARYAAVAESLQASSEMTAERSWSVMASAAGQSTNIMAVQYLPSLGTLGMAIDTAAQPAFRQTQTIFQLDDLFGFDPAIVEEAGEDAGGGAGAEAGLGATALTAAPNPFRSRTALTCRLSPRSTQWIEVFDAAGRRIRTLRLEDRPGGTARFVWDGRDEAGSPVAAGAYLCRLSSGGPRHARSVIVLH
jgi:hypothetical protein